RIAGANEPVRITGEHPVYVLRPVPGVRAGRRRVPSRPTYRLPHECSAPRPHETYRLEWLPAAQVRAGDLVAFPRRALQLCGVRMGRDEYEDSHSPTIRSSPLEIASLERSWSDEHYLYQA